MHHKYALISVYDKTGIADIAKCIARSGYQIIATGGTAKILVQAGLKIVPIEQITGNPEAFAGRMKTISFQVESGILFDRDKPEQVKQAKNLGVPRIDIVVANYYPFLEISSQPNVTIKQAIESIDVGGPTMVRAAAKNYSHVLVINDPQDYPKVIQALQKKSVTLQLRRELAAKAFGYLSIYDATVAKFLNSDEFPENMILYGQKYLNLRYGDNPHQRAALYIDVKSKSPLVNLKQLGGREPSASNITDIDAGIKSVALFDQPAAVVIKHNTPCGIAIGKNVSEALNRAITSDPESAFGGVIVVNKSLNVAAAKVLASFKIDKKSHMDVIAAPSIDASTQKLLAEVRKNTGLYTFTASPKLGYKQQIKWVDHGFIVQTENEKDFGFKNWKIVTQIRPTLKQIGLMQIGWKFIMRIKSNCIIVLDRKNPMTRGIGTGQTSRVRATRIALEQAGKYAQHSILISDGFFPFPDAVELAIKAGIAVIVQPGGSINDTKIIEAANQAKIAMVFTGRRAFWH